MQARDASRTAPTTARGRHAGGGRDLFEPARPDAAKAEADRRLPRSTVDAMKAAHAFRMPMPAAWGGPELPIADMLLVLEELAYADGSAGWCAMIGCDSGLLRRQARGRGRPRGLRRPRPRHRRARPRPPARPCARATAGASPAAGRSAAAAPTPTASWAARSSTTPTATGSPSPTACPPGAPSCCPIDEVTIHDTWDPMGLAGTGSHDYSVDGRVGARRARHAAARSAAAGGRDLRAPLVVHREGRRHPDRAGPPRARRARGHRARQAGVPRVRLPRRPRPPPRPPGPQPRARSRRRRP